MNTELVYTRSRFTVEQCEDLIISTISVQVEGYSEVFAAKRATAYVEETCK